MEGMTRSEVADQAGVSKETVRYYENRGLIPHPRRSSTGYRIYVDDFVDRIRFIKRAQSLGFTLAQIKELVELRLKPGGDCGDIRGKAEAELAEVRSKIADLIRIESALEELIRTCSGEGPISDCPILDALESDSVFDDAGR